MKKKINIALIFLICLMVTNTVLAYKCPNNLDYVGCGSGTNAVTGIPAIIPRLVSFAVALMKVIIPVAIIISGTIEMFKSIISGNPDNIPKGKKRIINKFVGALLAFFIISFTTNIVKLIARRNEKLTIASCLSCYLNNNCVDDISVCTGVNDKEIGGEGNEDLTPVKDDENVTVTPNEDNTGAIDGWNPPSQNSTSNYTPSQAGMPSDVPNQSSQDNGLDIGNSYMPTEARQNVNVKDTTLYTITQKAKETLAKGEEYKNNYNQSATLTKGIIDAATEARAKGEELKAHYSQSATEVKKNVDAETNRRKWENNN